jgi:23S rRNA pseudouridine2605 synthase
MAQLLEQPVVSVERWCDELAEQYRQAGHGFELVRVAGGYRYQTCGDLTPYVERFVLNEQQPGLSGAALETLAIVAYKQPISRAQVASIRGVDPDGVLRTLAARGYIGEVGRDPAPARRCCSAPRRVPREARARLARRPAADRRVHPRRRRGRGARARPAVLPVDETPRPTMSDPTRMIWASRSRPCGSSWPAQRRAARRRAPAEGARRHGMGEPAGLRGPDRGGRVTVNGEVAARPPGRPRPRPHRGRRRAGGREAGPRVLPAQQAHRRGHDRQDTHGRPTVTELVPDEPRVFPVGRLDIDTEGLLLLTNDGDLANRIAHPRHGIDKEYLAEVAGGAVAPGAVRRLRDGVELDDGITAPARVSQPSPGLLRITIHEGRNRQVRRMCEAVGHPVQRLVRTRIGPISDRSLAPVVARAHRERRARHCRKPWGGPRAVRSVRP